MTESGVRRADQPAGPRPGGRGGAGAPVRRLLAAVAVLVAALAAPLATALPAAAHNVLVSSDPADGSQLDAPPTSVTLTFDQPVQNFEPVVVVTGPDGQSVDVGTPEVASTSVTATVGALPAAGAYTVAYRIVSADGHPVQGQIGFQLVQTTAPTTDSVTTTAPTSSAPTSSSVSSPSATDPSTTPSTTAAVTPAAQDSSGGLAGWIWVVLAVAAVVVVVAVVLILRRPSGPPRS
ncbi:copper resistance CopC family protein [Nakamurella leprariae]|nr:copper resistance CopC family protein [Nakamurella leprariae]